MFDDSLRDTGANTVQASQAFFLPVLPDGRTNETSYETIIPAKEAFIRTGHVAGTGRSWAGHRFTSLSQR